MKCEMVLGGDVTRHSHVLISTFELNRDDPAILPQCPCPAPT